MSEDENEVLTEEQKRIWRLADKEWRREITKYIPQIAVMSFYGPEATIRWLMQHVDLKPEEAALADRLKFIEASDLTDDQKMHARLQAIFPNLRRVPPPTAGVEK